MIRKDRVLLTRLSAVNQHMGEIVMRMLRNAFDDADLTAPDLRSVGSGLLTLNGELTDVGTAMILRANELDGTPPLPAATSRPSGAAVAVADLTRDMVIYLDRIDDHVALLAEVGRLNGQRPTGAGYWWEFIGPVTGSSPDWGDTRPVLAVGVRGESGILIWAEDADPEPHAIPESTGRTNDDTVSYARVRYARVRYARTVQRMRVPPGREIPLGEVLSALAEFCATGKRPDRVRWREVDFDTAYGPDTPDTAGRGGIGGGT